MITQRQVSTQRKIRWCLYHISAQTRQLVIPIMLGVLTCSMWHSWWTLLRMIMMMAVVADSLVLTRGGPVRMLHGSNNQMVESSPYHHTNHRRASPLHHWYYYQLMMMMLLCPMILMMALVHCICYHQMVATMMVSTSDMRWADPSTDVYHDVRTMSVMMMTMTMVTQIQDHVMMVMIRVIMIIAIWWSSDQLHDDHHHDADIRLVMDAIDSVVLRVYHRNLFVRYTSINQWMITIWHSESG